MLDGPGQIPHAFRGGFIVGQLRQFRLKLKIQFHVGAVLRFAIEHGWFSGFGLPFCC